MSDQAPRLLLLETSGRNGLAALAEGEDLLVCRPLDETRRHARDLAPAVAELLREQRWKASDLAGVIVSRGPGSYTGLRVGLMSAKTLAYATRLCIDRHRHLRRCRAAAPPECSRVDVLADAQKDQVYVQSFQRRPRLAARDRACHPALSGMAERARSGRLGEWAGTGEVAQRAPMSILCVDSEDWAASAESLLVLGLARYRANERDDVFALEPLYLRASSAEEQWRIGASEDRPLPRLRWRD